MAVEIENDLISQSLTVSSDCVADIRNILFRARTSVVRHINNVMPLAYWLIGRRIVLEEQQGKKRATYGERLLKHISRELTATWGNGFGEPHLRNCRLFYRTYPTEEENRYALRIKLRQEYLCSCWIFTSTYPATHPQSDLLFKSIIAPTFFLLDNIN